MLSIFLSFPQSEEAILKIIQDETSYKQFVKEYSEAISVISRGNSVKFFYDSNNIKYFIDSCKKFESDIYLGKAENQIREFIRPKSVDIQDKTVKNKSCVYTLWNINKLPCVEYTYKIIEEIAERIILYKNEKFLLFNILKNIETDRNVLLVCKDAKHCCDLPVFVRIPYITDKPDLESWLKTNHIVEFSLLDKDYFTETHMFEQGQRVYKNIKTNCYWYLDNLHKDHYEIFNNNGEHIGEADLKGIINETKKIRTKN